MCQFQNTPNKTISWWVPGLEKETVLLELYAFDLAPDDGKGLVFESRDVGTLL